jgi:hypothetical protein
LLPEFSRTSLEEAATMTALELRTRHRLSLSLSRRLEEGSPVTLSEVGSRDWEVLSPHSRSAPTLKFHSPTQELELPQLRVKTFRRDWIK